MKFQPLARLVIALMILPIMAVPADASTTATLVFESQALDLDTGTVYDCDHEGWAGDLFLGHPEADLLVSYHADRWPHGVVVQNRSAGVEIAFLEGTEFDAVVAADLAYLTFSTEVIDRPLGAGDTVVLCTSSGTCFKLGNASETAWTVTFEYELLAGSPATASMEGAEVSSAETVDAGMTAEAGLVAEAPVTAASAEGAASSAPTETKLIASDGAVLDHFGQAVAVDGDTAVVGAYYDDDKGDASGSVYVYRRSGMTWIRETKLTAIDAHAWLRLGWSVAVSGDTIVAGTPGYAAYVFTREGTTWTEQPKLTPDDPQLNHYFAWSVAVSGDTAVVGAIGDWVYGQASGAAYVFTRSGETWAQQAKLIASDGHSWQHFGYSVAVSGDTAVVGTGGSGAYAFSRNGTAWSEQAKLTPSGGVGGWFGRTVAVSGDAAVVGDSGEYNPDTHSHGSAYVFSRSGLPPSWTQQAKLTASDGAYADSFGQSVALSGDMVVVGAIHDDDKGDSSGSAYAFTRSGTTWIQEAKMTASDGASGDFFGLSVGVSDSNVLVGAPRDDDKGSDSGSAYVYSLNQPPVADAGGPYSGDEGSAIALSSASASDLDGDPLDYDWSVDDDTACGFDYPTALNPNLTCSDDGTYQATLTVDDGVHDPVSDGATVTVYNVAPSLALSGDATVDESSSYTLNVSAVSDPGDDTLSACTVKWGDGDSEDCLTAIGGSLDHTYADGLNNYTISVDLADEDGTYADVDTLDLVVVNVEPSLSLGGDASGQEGSPYTVNLSAVTDSGDDTVTACIVYWGDGVSEDCLGAIGGTLGHTYADGPNDYTISVDLADEDGTYADVDTLDLVVVNVEPSLSLGGDVSGQEGSPYTVNLSAVTDSGDDTVTACIVYWGDGVSEDCLGAIGGTLGHTYADGPNDYTISVDLTDEDGTYQAVDALAVAVTNVAPTISLITAPTEPVDINDQSAVVVTVEFSDPSSLDTHLVTWDWGDGSDPDTKTNATSPASQGHSYGAPGVYAVHVTVTDDDGGSDSESYEFIVVYDPEGGFVSGGGWINSPEGACPRCPTSPEGKATLGFVSKYKKGASVPTGQTEFQFKAGDLNFHSSSYEWLVIAGANAKYKGVGTINGEGMYKFMLTATDGALLGGGKADEFRIRIWDDNGLYYDNKASLGEEEYGGTELGGGNIMIHKAKK